MGQIWTKKHIPSSSSSVFQENFGSIRSYVQHFKKGSKAVLIHGPTGIGKTVSIHILASELNYEIIELNASDFRDEASILSVIGNASQQMSLFSKGKIIIKPMKLEEKHMLMLLSETSLKKTWQNPYDERWDDVL